ncbi:MAG: hypothetical protein JWO11_4130 [Nocardioides sp.]|nr:hypothetical protein [Nocardioides sp.]
MTMRTAVIALAAVAAGFVVGCSSAALAGGPEGDAGTSVTEVRLSDNTRCAVMDKPGSGGAAIDCDWRP